MIDFNKEEKTFKDIVARMEGSLHEIRTGRAHISMVENIMVEAYGSKMPLSHVATLSTPDSRTIIIKPWDRSMLIAIEQALGKSQLGAAPIAEKDQVRLSLPPLTEERRRDIIKMMGGMVEDIRIAVRRHRDEIWKTIQEEERAGTVSEDQKFSQKERMEKIVEETNKKIAELAAKKESELLEI